MTTRELTLEKKSTVHYSSHPSHCGIKCVVGNSHCTHSAFCFQSSTANLKTVCRGLLYFTFLKLTSTLVGQHSTARLSMILASSGSSNSTAAFHKRTEFGTCSRAREEKQLCQSQQSSLPKTIVFFKDDILKALSNYRCNFLKKRREGTVLILALASTMRT